MKIATIGTGFIVDNFISAAKDNEGIEVCAVYSRDPKKAEEFAGKHDIKKSYSDLGEMFTDKQIEFIYVASPNSLHYKHTKNALLAGKNVICEKPFTSTVAELAELIEIAKKCNLFLFEAITVPHLPNFKEIKKHIDEISPVKVMQMNFSQYSSRYDALLRGENPNVFSTEFSGGALMDINYYNLYFAILLFGEPKSFEYTANIAKNGIDTSGVLLLKYDNFIAVCVGCKDSKSVNMVQIQGEKGYIYVGEPCSMCASYSVNTREGSKEYNLQTNENALYYELGEFRDIYKNSDYDQMNELLENSVIVMNIVEKARKEAGVIFAADKNS